MTTVTQWVEREIGPVILFAIVAAPFVAGYQYFTTGEVFGHVISARPDKNGSCERHKGNDEDVRHCIAIRRCEQIESKSAYKKCMDDVR